MLDVESGFGKEYVRLLVEEIRVWGRKVVMRRVTEGVPIGYSWLPG